MLPDHRKAFFLETEAGNLFSLVFFPLTEGCQEAVLLVPPFADEMNKSRRMINLQARDFQEHGYTVFVLDLFGTGDSSGEFLSATWEGWKKNVYQAWSWLEGLGLDKVHLWGIRLGCLLALDSARTFQIPVASYLFWNPVANGERFATQLLRLRVAEQFGASAGETVQSLKEELESSGFIEIAGYEIASELFDGFSKLKALDFSPVDSRVFWLECSPTGEGLLPASMKILDRWQETGVAVKSSCVSGAQFWSSVEIEEAPALLLETMALFAEGRNSGY